MIDRYTDTGLCRFNVFFTLLRTTRLQDTFKKHLGYVLPWSFSCQYLLPNMSTNIAKGNTAH